MIGFGAKTKTIGSEELFHDMAVTIHEDKGNTIRIIIADDAKCRRDD